jgi:hypothetical protein
MSVTIPGIYKDGAIELLERPIGLHEGRVVVTVQDEQEIRPESRFQPRNESEELPSQTRGTFERLSERWKSETGLLSNESTIVLHPAYQQIMGLGAPAVPLILDALAREDYSEWFWALRSITREDPVQEDDAGDVEKMAEAWLQWGTEKGYYRNGSRPNTRPSSPTSSAPDMP